ncbi:MAG: AmmeMemoRadiSam system radical SAM enzyme [Candidatus Glassbacteria bacterium]
MKEAMLYEKLEDGKVRCNLCAHRCKISAGKKGVCLVRENRGGSLYSLVYDKISSANVDPIEKKPLFHFIPGSRAFSIATVGCNFKCDFCQNSSISQIVRNGGAIYGTKMSAEELVEVAKRYNCRSISYTYTEPTVFFELAYDTAKLASEEGIKNNFVTNGFMTAETLEKIRPYLHGANVDLKSFKDETYKKVIGGRLHPVLETIKLMKEYDMWVEVTTLIVPGLNDDEDELREIAEFIAAVGVEIPWHVTRFHPDYRMTDRHPTTLEKMKTAERIGYESGLRYVYCGNVPGQEGENTLCYNCKTLLVKRWGFEVMENRVKNGKCPECAAEIDGIEMG